MTVTRSINEWDPFTTGWVAALIEGEGTITCTRRANGQRPYRPLVRVEMTDRDVVERLAQYIGIGSVTSREQGPKALGSKRIYTYCLSSMLAVEDLLYVLYPHMGERRKARIEQCGA